MGHEMTVDDLDNASNRSRLSFVATLLLTQTESVCRDGGDSDSSATPHADLWFGEIAGPPSPTRRWWLLLRGAPTWQTDP